MVLDGSENAALRADSMLQWDVDNGVARRAWARNEGAMWAIDRAQTNDPRLKVTRPSTVDPDILDRVLEGRE